MNTRLHELVEKMESLEKELAAEIQKSEEEYSYKIRGTIATFESGSFDHLTSGEKSGIKIRLLR